MRLGNHSKEGDRPKDSPQIMWVASSSSVSSSLSYEELYGFSPTYISTCETTEAINNPIAGQSATMHYFGDFSTEAPDWSEAFDGDNKLQKRGGLVKTRLNQGRMWCQDANLLFSMGSGLISLRINLPYAITNGVYEPLFYQSDCYLNQFVLFGVNMGEHYITNPGVYAALTPSGLLFEVWSSGERAKLYATNVNIAANTDCILDFVWDRGGSIIDGSDHTMAIVVNRELKASSLSKINDDSIAGKPLFILDTPTAKSNLECILRRVEIYTNTSLPIENQQTSSSSSLENSESSGHRYLAYNTGEDTTWSSYPLPPYNTYRIDRQWFFSHVSGGTIPPVRNGNSVVANDVYPASYYADTETFSKTINYLLGPNTYGSDRLIDFYTTVSIDRVPNALVGLVYPDDTIDEVYVNSEPTGIVTEADDKNSPTPFKLSKELLVDGDNEVRFRTSGDESITTKVEWNRITTPLTFSQTLGVNYTGLSHYWSTKLSSGTTLQDLVGSNNGTLINGASFSSWGKFGQALALDGTNDYVELENPLEDATHVSVGCWFYLNDTTSYCTILGDLNDASANDFIFAVTYNTIVIRADKSGAILSETIPYSGDFRNKWTHIVWQMEPTMSKVYINGELYATVNETGSQVGFHAATPDIGRTNDEGAVPLAAGPFDGQIDDLFYIAGENNLLSDAQIGRLYTGVSPVIGDAVDPSFSKTYKAYNARRLTNSEEIVTDYARGPNGPFLTYVTDGTSASGYWVLQTDYSPLKSGEYQYKKLPETALPNSPIGFYREDGEMIVSASVRDFEANEYEASNTGAFLTGSNDDEWNFEYVSGPTMPTTSGQCALVVPSPNLPNTSVSGTISYLIGGNTFTASGERTVDFISNVTVNSLPSTIDCRVMVDDRLVDVYVNGVAQGISTTQAYVNSWVDVSIDPDDIIVGDNEIRFRVINDIVFASYHTFRVEWSGQYSPEESSSSLEQIAYSRRAKASLPFVFYGGTGDKIVVSDISFPTVVRQKIDLNSLGPYGGQQHSLGVTDSTSSPPNPPNDLPPGITEVRGK